MTYSVQMAQPDAQVEQALLHAVTHDPNINVRLSAVEALEKYSAKPDIPGPSKMPCPCRNRPW